MVTFGPDGSCVIDATTTAKVRTKQTIFGPDGSFDVVDATTTAKPRVTKAAEPAVPPEADGTKPRRRRARARVPAEEYIHCSIAAAEEAAAPIVHEPADPVPLAPLVRAAPLSNLLIGAQKAHSKADVRFVQHMPTPAAYKRHPPTRTPSTNRFISTLDAGAVDV